MTGLRAWRGLRQLGLLSLIGLLVINVRCSNKSDSKTDPVKKPRNPRPISANLDDGLLSPDDLATSSGGSALDDPLLNPPTPPVKGGEDIEKFEKVDTPTGEPGDGKPGQPPPPPPPGKGEGKPDKAEVKVDPSEVQTPEELQQEWEFDDYCKVAYDKDYQELIKEEYFIKKKKPEELFDAWLFEIKKTVSVIEAVVKRDHRDIDGVLDLVVTTAANCQEFFSIIKDIRQIDLTGGANGGRKIAENPDGIMLPDPLAGLPDLISVTLNHNRMMSIRGVRRLPNLENLFVSYNFILRVGVEDFFFVTEVEKGKKGMFYEDFKMAILADPEDNTKPFGVRALRKFGIGHQSKLDFNEEEGTTEIIFNVDNPPELDLIGLKNVWNPLYYRSLVEVGVLDNRVDPNVFRLFFDQVALKLSDAELKTLVSPLLKTLKVVGAESALDFGTFVKTACDKAENKLGFYPESLYPLLINKLNCKSWCSPTKGPGCP